MPQKIEHKKRSSPGKGRGQKSPDPEKNFELQELEAPEGNCKAHV